MALTWRLRLLLVVIGLPTFLAGGVAVFVTDNGTGAGALVVFGGLARLAGEEQFDREQVRGWLRGGDPGRRIAALGMMQAQPDLRDFDSVLGTIIDSRSAFEQYHALRLALTMLGDLDAEDRQRLRTGLESQRGFRFRRDTDRWQLSELILKRLEPHS